MSPQQTIGHYRITTMLGKGGMGEVWRATDNKLGREVAIKILPAAFATDAERLARFQREAQVLASLNHQYIAAIYGVEERALVMELVEGPTLGERIAQGPVALDEALTIARQIIDALEYAHERGIIHRDLKPANIKITPEGSVKILDFGLAKAVDEDPAAVNPADSPTLTLAATRGNVILGTAAYMSPEQAHGKPADRRADIWSFGVVLFEMLSGKGAFSGESVSDTLASVLKSDVDWQRLPADTPPAIRNLVRRCLIKDRRQRLQAIGDARIAIDEYLADPTPSVPPPTPATTTKKLPWIIATALLIVALGVGYVAYHHVTEETRVLKLSVLAPEKISADMQALSPDGRHLVFVGTRSGRSELWVRDLDSLVSRPLSGTENATYPFWSPDGRTVAFFQTGKLKRIDISGGPALTLSDAANGRSGSWSQNGVILFAPTVNVGLNRVPAAGGAATQVTTVDRTAGENAHRMPWFLPDGHHFLYTARNNDPEKNAVYIADLNSKDRKKVLLASSNAMYAPPGFLLFLRQQVLMAQPFDAAAGETRGDAVPIAEQIRFDGLNLTGRFSVSQTGVLAYISGILEGAFGSVQLTWVDRSGKVTGTIGKPGVTVWPAISPDGHTVAFDRVDQNGSVDIWLYDQTRRTESRFTFNAPVNQFPVWSPDGNYIAYRSGLYGTSPPALIKRTLSSTAQNEILDTSMAIPTDWSRDGRYIITQSIDPQTNFDISVLPLFGDRKLFPYLHMDFNEMQGKLSPDGRWLAYTSNETKQDEIYIQTFPNPGGKWQVSTAGGSHPVWSRDGKELFFIDSGGKMMAVDIRGGAKLEAGVPKPLFDTHLRSTLSGFDVSKDGHFLIPNLVQDSGGAPITVVVNWAAGLMR